MELQWTDRARSDLARLYAFLADKNPKAAARTVRALVAAPEKLRAQPRIGESLEEFAPREVRRWLIGPYEMRYEIRRKPYSSSEFGTPGRIGELLLIYPP